MKGVMRSGNKGKLSPFEILERVGEVVYRLVLPSSLSSVHPMFHVSMLQRYILDESHMISIDLMELGPNLTYEEEPIVILDRQVRKLRTKEIALVKVQWRHQFEGEATWEIESVCRPATLIIFRLQVSSLFYVRG